jgi:L-rhamnose mutarotase
MIRKAFIMTLKPHCQIEYRRRHDQIWPELQDVLKTHGVHNYSIFLECVSDRLFGYVELDSEERWKQIADTSVCRRWWDSMKELMMTNADASPVAVELDEVFHLD